METVALRIRKVVLAIVFGSACAPVAVSALGNLHPYFTISHLLPPELNNIGGIGGIGLLPNGDGAICTWGGSQQPAGTPGKSNGEVWIIPNLAAGAPGTPVRIATGLREPLGVAVVGQDFYVMEKPRIAKFTGSGSTWTKSTLWSLPTEWYNDNQWHHFSFNLVTRDNAFWFTTGTAYDYDPKDPLQRGALIKVPFAGGGFTQLARGLRNTNGLGIGPDGEFFVPENQGHWKPADALYHLPTANVPANGRFYGFRTEGNNACGIAPPAVDGSSCPEDPEYPPAIWIPYGGFSNSPTRPILLKAGPYAGQMISGDVFHGGTLRYFLEKVDGEYQGAVFAMMTAGAGGINFGINQFLYTPGGALLAAGIGGGTCGLGGSGNWNWNGTCRGLDLLTPTGKSAFEILAVRSIPGGFDVEFTQPANAAAGVKSNWQVKTTVFTPVQAYGQDGGGADNNVAVDVSSAVLSPDGRHARLQLASLLVKRMYAITVNNVSSATGEQPYANVAYYTLNKVGPAVATGPAAAFGKSLRAQVHAGRVTLELPFRSYRIGLFGLDGKRFAEASGGGPGTLRSGPLEPGLYFLSGSLDGSPFRRLIQVR
ncbi:MAG: hypothetical protein JWP91_4472 [Fibrobacteres bacterium]|nr:hypothetical protein [Fibrobacterota bacterium]